MALEIFTYALGPMDNNTYLLLDSGIKEAVLVDPTFDSQLLLPKLIQENLKLTALWLTHAHFDHTAGVRLFHEFHQPPVPIGLHPGDLELYRTGGGANYFGIEMIALPDPQISFEHGQQLRVGSHPVEVRHTPGHSAGHVIFYIQENEAVLTGDLIFKGGVGRTDLRGGSNRLLLKSIYEQVFTLPPQTAVLPGHGPATTVQDELEGNPYLG